MQVEPVTMQMEMKVRGRLTLKEHDHIVSSISGELNNRSYHIHISDLLNVAISALF